MFSKETKITTLFWIAISGLFLTTIYSILLAIMGIKSMNMISYVYNQMKRREQKGQ
ncbi:hypothetical protein HPT25_06015 [Bacillus sp. BRMEA1]|uniref:hypothetical protein n=1 Tax=Neobacillus endophyticus TaxID=2738405 RepID=UPI00156325B6|nr:hypothetical protein [Neobacillus endophyticus]NRD77051.1 hypothetical protein [Neobacillus endophyticus]